MTPKLTLKTLFLLLLMIPGVNSFATHIMGGNFELRQIGANEFEVTLRVYRDCLPGNSTSVSPSIINLYERNTNNLINTISLTSSLISTTTLVLGDACYAPTGLCVEERIFVDTFTFADNVNGYYLSWGVCCRNGLINNLNVGPPASPTAGSVFYISFPDPAITAMNSSPNFGPYPTDGYFCVNSPKIFNFNVTDADGDSLAYYLVNPYDDSPTTLPFAALPWQATYSAANIVGNVVNPIMSVDINTGDIYVNPEVLGVFVFALLVEEWRNGVKIGEVVRDIQYQALNCTFDQPPSFSTMPDTTYVEVLSNGCIDISAADLDPTDTIWIEPVSTDFDLPGNFVYPDFISESLGDTTWGYSNHLGTPLVTMPWFRDPGTGVYGSVGSVSLRFCIDTECADLAIKDFDITLMSYSLGCSGSDTALSNITVSLLPMIGNQDPTPNVFTPNGDGQNDTYHLAGIMDPCFDELTAEVYNRWGLKVYEAEVPEFQWDGKDFDGKELPEGTYYILLNGTYGSSWVNGVRTSNDVTDQFPVTLFRGQ